jgi:Mrp family chromosome partitioning ATPase
LDLEAYLKLLWRWLWFLVLGAAVGIVVSYLVLDYLGLYPGYQAVATLSVGTQVETETLSDDELAMGEDLVPSYVVLAERPPVTEAVVENLNLSISADDLTTYRLEVEQVGQTRIVQITAKDPDPNMAAAIANELARQVVSIAPVRPNEFVQIVAPAKVPEKPSFEPYLIMAVGGMVGMLLAGTVVVLIELERDRPQTLTWAAARIDMPLLGTFKSKHRFSSARRASRGRSPITGNWRPPAPVWWVVMETFERALAKWGEGETSNQGHILVVTSPGRSRSKPVAALELARAWATTGYRVILVDADSHRPTLHRWFGLPNQAGVTTLLTQDGQVGEQLDGLLSASGTQNLELLTSGPPPTQASALLYQPSWDELISELRQKGDLVVVTSPAVSSGPEVIILATRADGVLLVIDLGKTGAASANQTADLLLKSGCKVLGAAVHQR